MPRPRADGGVAASTVLEPEHLDQAREPEDADQDEDAATIRAAVPPEVPREAGGHDEQDENLNGGSHAGHRQRVLEGEEHGEGDREAQPCWQARTTTGGAWLKKRGAHGEMQSLPKCSDNGRCGRLIANDGATSHTSYATPRSGGGVGSDESSGRPSGMKSFR